MKPALKLRTGVQWQQPQLQQKLRRSVSHTAEQVHQLSVDVVVNLKLAGFPPQHDRAGAAKDFDVTSVFLGEHSVDDLQQGGLVADAGDGCSDRLFHAPS